VIDDKVKCLTPEETLAKLKGVKILSVQNRVPKFASEIQKSLGIVVERVSFKEVNENARAVEEAAAQAVAKSWADKAKRIEYVSDEMLLGCARMYLGMKKTLADHGAKAITINCLGGCYTGKLDAYPCLGFMQLQDEGLMGVCENDLESTVSMIVFSVLTGGRIGYVSDPALDMPNRAISYAHCVSTRKFFGPNGPESEFEILTHSEDRKGASVRAFAPIGQPVTTVKFNCHKRMIALHTGVITGNDCDDRACRTKIVAHVTGDYSKIELRWDGEKLSWPGFNWHRVTFMGDFRSDVEAFAKKIGYRIMYES
jgi:L-fucose isomerase-like protein